MSGGFLALEVLLAQGRPPAHGVAYVQGGLRTWGELSAEAERWRVEIASAKARRVAVFTKGAWDFAAVLLGAWSAGAEVVLPGDALPETRAQLEGQVELFVGDLDSALHVARDAHVGAGFRPRLHSDSSLPSAHLPALTVFTSGTTGAQQPFPKRRSQLSAEVSCLEETFGARLGEATVLATVSHQHIYGLLFKVLWPLCAGRPFVSEPLFFPEELLATARAQNAFALVASPAHLKRLPAFLPWSDVRPNTRAVFSSGGPLPWEAAAQTASLLGRAPIEVYGSSETGGVAWRERVSDASPWIPFSDVALELEPDTQRLKVRSPKLPDEAWFVTADRAALSSDGTLTLLGRDDRVVKLEEKRVSLQAVEAALRDTGLVVDARVVVLPGEREQLGAVVQLRDRSGQDTKAVITALRQALAPRIEAVALPRRFRFVDALPFDERGKTTEAALRRLFDPTVNEPDLLATSTPTPATFEARLRLPASLRAFEGHFPQAKVLPGVVQVDWAQRYGRERLHVRGDFVGMASLKFQRVLMPGDEVDLRLEYLPERGRLKFQFQSPRGLHSHGVLLFRER